MGFEVYTSGRPFGLAGSKVKSPVVLRTFDDVTHDEATREVDTCVCAKAVGGVICVVDRPVDRKGATVVIEADDVFLFNVARSADFNPGVVHGVIRLRPLQRRSERGTARQWAPDEVRRVFRLPEKGGDDFPVGLPETVIGFGHVRL